MVSRQGGLVRERRRQRGLPLPIAEKVLPFGREPPPEPALDDEERQLRPMVVAELSEQSATVETEHIMVGAMAAARRRMLDAEGRMRAAFETLETAEHRGVTAREIAALEAAYAHEVATYTAAVRHLAGGGSLVAAAPV
jgi:hypothetical protein